MDIDSEDPDKAQIRKLQVTPRLRLTCPPALTSDRDAAATRRFEDEMKLKTEVKTEELIFAPGEVIDLT
jgi:hypothetical protein